MKVVSTSRPAPVTPSTGKITQRHLGTVTIVGDHGIETKYPTGPRPKRTSQAKLRAAGDGSAPKRVKAQDERKERAKAVQNKNAGWTKRTLCSGRTRFLMTDLSPLLDRCKNVPGVKLTYLVLKYVPGMVIPSADLHANLQRLLRLGRDDIGSDNFHYLWDIETLKGSRQPHINLLTALTDQEAYKVRRWWKGISGHARDVKLNWCAHMTVKSDYEVRTKGLRQCAEEALKYFTMTGDHDAAIRKAHQYHMPAGWAETGSGAMYGMSSTLKKAEEVSIEITNIRQRIAVDRYVTRRLGISKDLIVWQYEDGSHSTPRDNAAFSPDRHGGSRRVVRVTPDMIRDIRYLVDHFA